VGGLQFEINGRSFYVGVDTGSEYPIINKKTADLVGLKNLPKIGEAPIPETDGHKKSGIYRVPLTLPGARISKKIADKINIERL
jgi:hypothetical protein